VADYRGRARSERFKAESIRRPGKNADQGDWLIERAKQLDQKADAMEAELAKLEKTITQLERGQRETRERILEP
jgi:hypothetical protein